MRNLRWVGVATDQYREMTEFLESTMGLRKNFEEPTSAEFTTAEGDQVQIMNLYELASRLPG